MILLMVVIPEVIMAIETVKLNLCDIAYILQLKNVAHNMNNSLSDMLYFGRKR